MIDAIERFATTYQHTVTLLGVIGTVSAVIVSLALASLVAGFSRPNPIEGNCGPRIHRP